MYFIVLLLFRLFSWEARQSDVALRRTILRLLDRNRLGAEGSVSADEILWL
jgi:hypothetical protein